MAFLQTRGSMEGDKASRAGRVGWKDVFVIALAPGWQHTQAGRRPSSGKEPVEEVKLTSHQRTVDHHVHKDKANCRVA